MQYGVQLNWAGLAVSGSLAHGTGCSGARSGAVLHWEWRHWCCVILPLLATHVSACDGPATLDPRIGALASRQGTCHTTGSTGLIVLRLRGPTNRQYVAQSDCVLQCPSRFLHITPPLGQLPRAVCAGLFSALCEPTSFFICPLASHPQRPGSSRYSIATQHSFPLTLQVDMRVHGVVHLAQDRFPHLDLRVDCC